MRKWIFKAVKVAGPGKAELTELSQKKQKRITAYENALQIASDSHTPDPPFSNYLVKGSIGIQRPPFPPFSSVFPTGNVEYGLCQALHCEETAVAALRVAYGKTYEEPILGFCGKNETSTPPTCCGNCRDILLDAFGPELEIVAGKPEGGTAVVSKLSDLLCESYETLPIEEYECQTVSKFLSLAHRECLKLVCDPYSPEKVHPERRYHVYLLTSKGHYFGARDVMCDYHPIYAGRDAVRQAIRNFDPFISKLVVVRHTTPNTTLFKAPHVMYKDRQHLLELNLQAELILDKEQDPPVFLINYQVENTRPRVIDAWTTTLKTWLPFPFTARNFGPEFLQFLEKYYQNRIPK